MGISGQPEALLNVSSVKREQIPVIKRFSGGGTVIVDPNTLFITFIMNKNQIDTEPFPEPILRWSAGLYTDAWQIPSFHLRENDYCIGEKKCGGNAQYIQKERWLHHTSFLWDYSDEMMKHLLIPAKRPKYREDRDHDEFLCRLKDHAKSPQHLIDQLKEALVKRLYIQKFDLHSWTITPHRQSLHFLEL